MTTPTSRLSAGATRPDKRPCSWRIAVRTRTVHLLIRRTLGPGMSEYLASRVRAAANVVIHEQTEIDSICGNHRIDEIVLRNNATALQSRLPCSAVFVFIGAEPAADWLPADLARDANGYLLTGSDAVRSGLWPMADRDPCPLETTFPACWPPATSAPDPRNASASPWATARWP